MPEKEIQFVPAATCSGPRWWRYHNCRVSLYAMPSLCMALGKKIEKLALAARGGLAQPAVCCCCCWWFVWFRFWTEQEREREGGVRRGKIKSNLNQLSNGARRRVVRVRSQTLWASVAQFPASSHAYWTAFRGVGARACEALQYASRVAHWCCVRVFLLVVGCTWLAGYRCLA